MAEASLPLEAAFPAAADWADPVEEAGLEALLALTADGAAFEAPAAEAGFALPASVFALSLGRSPLGVFCPAAEAAGADAALFACAEAESS